MLRGTVKTLYKEYLAILKVQAETMPLFSHKIERLLTFKAMGNRIIKAAVNFKTFSKLLTISIVNRSMINCEIKIKLF